MTVLTQARHRDLPGLAWKLLAGRASVADHPRVRSLDRLTSARVMSLDPSRPLPVQVDGDFIGEELEARFEITPGVLRIVA